jgi:hypothetical protein
MENLREGVILLTPTYENPDRSAAIYVVCNPGQPLKPASRY